MSATNDTVIKSFSIFSPALFPKSDRPLTTTFANRLDWLSASVAFILALLIPSNKTILRHSIVIPLIAVLFYRVRQTALPGGYVHHSDSYMTYIHLIWTLIRWIDFTVLRVPETSIYRTQEPSGTPVETSAEIQSLPLHRKLWWNFNLVSNLRGIGWSWRVKNVTPTPPKATRTSACLSHLLLVIKYNIILNFHDYFIKHTNLYQPQTISTFFSLPFPHQCLCVWISILNSAAGIGIGYHLPALLCISLHLTTPQLWPPVFGPWSCAYTVRNAWGRLWHQYLRRAFESLNALLLDTLYIKRGTLSSKYTQIYAAFLFSAFFHHTGALNIPYFESVRYQFLFFLCQPLLITIEDIAIALGTRLGMKDGLLTRSIGYIWTYAAVTFTGRYMTVWFLESGAAFAENPKLFEFWELVMPLVGLPGRMEGPSGKEL